MNLFWVTPSSGAETFEVGASSWAGIFSGVGTSGIGSFSRVGTSCGMGILSCGIRIKSVGTPSFSTFSSSVTPVVMPARKSAEKLVAKPHLDLFIV